jgi:hypothetical protein
LPDAIGQIEELREEVFRERRVIKELQLENAALCAQPSSAAGSEIHTLRKTNLFLTEQANELKDTVSKESKLNVEVIKARDEAHQQYIKQIKQKHAEEVEALKRQLGEQEAKLERLRGIILD